MEKTLIKRNRPATEPQAQPPDIGELCVALKEGIREIRVGMSSAEMGDLVHRLLIQADAIDAAVRVALPPAETTED